MPEAFAFPADAAPPWSEVTGGAIVAETRLAVLSFTGADAAAFLHGQLSSDVRRLLPGAGQWTSYNSPKGRMLATLFLYRPPTGASDRFEALVAADLASALRQRLAMFVLRSNLAVADESATLACLGVGGPAAARALATLGPPPGPGAVTAADELRLVGLPDGRFVVVAPAAVAPGVVARLTAVATPASYDAWSWLGICAGVPMVTAATQDLFVAQAANWDALGGVDFLKGCYPGQEIVARTQYLGRLKERLYLLAADVPVPAPGSRLYSPAFGDQACGTVVNSAPRPTGGSALLAVLQIDAATAVRLGSPEGPALAVQPLPYALPAPTEPRGRVRL